MNRKSQFVFIGLIMVALLLVAGCGTPVMRNTTTIHQPGGDYALVTFLRPTSFGGAINFGLWDGDQFIGILNAKRVVQYKAAPGQHLFLARAENWSYVEATLEAGKQYYIIGKVFPGVWKARVALSPVVKDAEVTEEKLDQWVSGGTPEEVIPEQFDAYQNPRQAQVREAMAKFDAGEVKFEVLETDDYR